MKRIIFYIVMSILFIFQTYTYTLAMMGGSRSSGGMGGDHMGGGMGYGRQYEHRVPNPDYERQQPRYNREFMDRNTAEGLARNYMMGRYGDTHHLGELKDHETYYTAEIRGPNGSLTDRLLIDKQSGNIHSLQ